MRMRLLPKEQKKAIETELPKILDEISQGKVVTLGEPCNCGSHIRHNNGGNYHQIVSIALDDGDYFIREYNTCELIDIPDWDITSKERVIKEIENAIREGWWWESYE